MVSLVHFYVGIQESHQIKIDPPRSDDGSGPTLLLTALPSFFVYVPQALETFLYGFH